MQVGTFSGKIITDIFNSSNSLGWKLNAQDEWPAYMYGITLICSIITYAVLNVVFKMRMNLFYSKLHLIFIFLSSFFIELNTIDYRIILFLTLSCLPIFILNLYYSLKNNESHATTKHSNS